MKPLNSPQNRQVFPGQIGKTLRYLIAIAGLVLIYQTWPLWFEFSAISPQVPLVAWARGCPGWCDFLACGSMVVALLLILRMADRCAISRWACVLFGSALGAAVLLNQHRLQPWAWEFGVLLLVMAALPDRKAIPFLRLFVASIYLHSGLSKLDVTFLTTHGEAFASVLTGTFGWDLSQAPVALRRVLVGSLPVGEIAVATGFCFAKTRWFAKWASVGMHLVLLWILGPWGLDHQPGVLIWNLYFIGQNLILFQPLRNPTDWEHRNRNEADQARFELMPSQAQGRMETEEVEVAVRSSSKGRWVFSRAQSVFGYGLAMFAILWPFFEPWGYCDHWPAWAVYASRPERTRVYLAEDQVPADLQDFVTAEDLPADAAERFLAGQAAWKRLRIDRWSLEVLHVPVYPQDRFQIGVALAVAERYELGPNIRVEIDSPADRWTGERTTRVLEGVQALQQAARRFRMNALPR